MTNDALPMRSFLVTIRKWLDAVEHHQTDDAGFFIDQVHAVGKMLAFDPEFARIFKDHQDPGPKIAAEQALDYLHAFLHAITDAARVGRFRPPPNMRQPPSLL